MKKFFAVLLTVLLLAGIGVGAYFFLTQESSAHEHQLGEWVLTKEATCLEDGVRERKCACGYSVKETVKALGHTYGESQTIEQTCTQDGCVRQICVNCGDELKTNVVEATGHEYGDWVVVVEPTCMTQGVRARVCMVCDYLDEDTVQTVGHRLDHVITTTEGSSTALYPQCGNCGTVMDTGYEYVREKEQQESYIKNCPRDFSFDVQYDGTEDDIYGNMIIVSEEYVYGMTNEEIFASSVERIEYVVSEKDDGVWTVSPAGAYLENKNYVAVITEKLTFCDHWGQRLSFRIDGPVVQEVVFNQNIVYLASFETIDPGYFPYTLAYDEETEQYQLVLSKVGIFDESFLGQILCVGQIMNDAEVFSSSGQCVFGKIVSVSEENGKAILRLDAPEFSEVFDKLNIQNGSGVSLNENSFDEDFEDLMYAKFISSDGFIEALATVQTAADKYAKEKGWKIDPIKIDKKYFKLTITPDLDNGIVKDSAGNEVEQIKVGFNFVFEPKITMYDSSEADGIKTELDVSITLKIDTYFYPTASAEKYESGPNKGDYYIHLDIDQRTVVDFTLDVSFKVLYDEVQESIYILNEDAQKIHTIHCIHGKNLKHSRKMTFGDVKKEFGKNYTEYECKLCKPFSLTTNSFVVLKDNEGSKVLHCMGCSYIKKADNYQEIESYMVFPGSGYKPCSNCFAGVDMEKIEQNAFEAYMEECFKTGDWVENYDKLKECANGALEESKKGSLSGKPQSIYEQDAIVSFKIFGVFNLGFYFDIEMDFELEVTLKYHLVQQTGRTHSVHLGKNAKGIYMPSTHSKEKDPKEIIGGEDFEEINTLNIQGKASVEFGIRVAMKLSTVISDKWAYIGIDAGVGIYMELSGVLNVDYVRDDEEDESFYAAYLEIGFYYDLNYRAYIKWIYEEGEKSLLKKTKIPFYKSGDNRAYYKYSDYKKEIVVDSDKIVFKDDLLKVHYFDLVEMKDKEDDLSIYGKWNEYSVNFDFFDKSGKKVDYCEVKHGLLVVAEDAPTVFDITMRITIVDERVPDSLAGYFAQRIGRNDINGAYFLDSVDVRVHRNTEYASMKIISVTPTTSPEIMEGEDVTFTITADEGVKYGVAFYYHNYQDELARFNTLEDSYTIKIPEAGTHMITVYPLDKNGEPIRGEGLGMSYRYVKAYSYDECASPKITTEDGKTVKQGVPYTITWKPSFYPTEKVVYSVYIQNDTTGTYSMVAQGLTETQITVPFSLMPDLGTYSFQVIASYTGTDREIHQSVSSWYPYGTVTLTLVQGDCAHTNTTVDEKKATCQENGYYHEICDDCGHRVTVIETFGNHEFKDGVCVVCGFGIENAKCPIPQFITKDQTIDLESDLLLEWVEQGSNIEYYLYVRHESVKDPADPGDAVKVYWFTGDHITVDGSFFSQTGDYMISLYARYKDVEGSQQDQGAYLTITVKELVCRHRNTNTVSGVEATCTEDGLTDGSVCANCGTVLMEQRKIPAMGHQWNDRTGQTLCQVCGVNLLCPAPVIFLDTTVIPYGSSLGISWTLDESAEYAVEYYLYVRCKDNPNPDYAGTPVFSSWIQASKCTISGDIFRKELNKLDESARAGSHEFEIFVYAHYTGYDGTQSGSARTVTVGEQQQLPSPEITSQNGQTVEQNSSFTLAWKSVDAEGAEVTYHVYLMKAGRSETNVSVGSTTGNMLTIPKAYFDQADTYVLYMVATDQNGYFTQSPSVGINVYVTAEEIKDKNDYDDPQNYANSFYYDYMGTLDNGEGYQNFYEALDVVMDEFHQNEDIDAELYEFDEITSEYIAGFVNYADFGLSEDEAFEVYWLYIMDHPLYYWISNMVAAYGPDIAILVNENYVKGSDRGYYNDLIYEGVEEVMQNVLGEESAYMISLSHYECVVKGVDYAYESDGITPQSADWAHSILGFFDHGKGVVCEGFAETYSLLLNFSEIPNTLVSGYSSNKKAHEWNLMQMDDGEWYWSDPTWDDNGDSLLGYDYRFFCVNDTQDVMYYALRDGDLYIVDQEESFMDDHFITWNNDSLDMNNALPARAKTPYAGVGDEMIMRDTFTMDDMTFAIAGYRKLQLTDVQKTGHVDIPEVVYYDGVTYTVISVGTIREDGTFGRDCVLNNKVTSIHIPKTIQCIWGAWMHTNKDHALYSQKLKKITVDDDNDYYYVKNGMLNCK